MKGSCEESKLGRTARGDVRTAEGKRDAVRPRSMEQDDVENNQSSAEPGGDNRDQSGSGDTQLEGHAVQALPQVTC